MLKSSLFAVIPDIPFTILRYSFADNTGWVFYRIDAPGLATKALVDIYRMDGTCIVEHWDVLQVVPANATNPVGFF